MCSTLRVEAHTDWAMISLTHLYKIPSSHVISSLKYQLDCILWGQSLIILGHLSCTISASNHSVWSFDVASCISCSLSGLAGVICVIWWTGIFSTLFYWCCILLAPVSGVPPWKVHLLWHFLCLRGTLCAHHIGPVQGVVSAILGLKLQ